MDSIKKKDFVNSLKYLLKETFEGSPETGSVYLDKGVGVFNSIENLSVEDASKSNGGANIAAHTEHLRYYIEVLGNFLEGNVQIADWSKSWAIQDVSEDEWTEIKTDLKSQFEKITESFNQKEDWSEDAMTEAIAIIVHSAYHLGAIRQIIKGQK